MFIDCCDDKETRATPLKFINSKWQKRAFKLLKTNGEGKPCFGESSLRTEKCDLQISKALNGPIS